MVWNRTRLATIAAFLLIGVGAANAEDRLTVGTNWLPDAERGGFYEADAEGLYRRHGLDVTIKPGGPQMNNPQLLAAGQLDIVMVTSAIEAFNYAHNDVPLVAVAAIYQRSPLILLAHRSANINSIADMRGKPIMISALSRNGFWRWLKVKYDFTDSQIRPYTFNLINFMVNPEAIQQGFITYEPYAVSKQGGDPKTFLLADSGFNDFGGLLLVRRETLEARPEVVHRFIQALSEGWRDFLFGDPAPGIALIKSQNTAITDDLIANSIKVIVDRGLIHSGDAEKFGIGAMTEDHWKTVYDEMSAAGIIEPGEYWHKAFDLSLVQSGLALPPH
jgi:NitT/TauT family transport system substrate-binding protein